MNKKVINKINKELEKCSNDELDEILDGIGFYNFTKEIEDETRSEKEEHIITFISFKDDNEKKVLNIIKKIKEKR